MTTNAAGDAGLDVVLPGTLQGGWVVTSTATLDPIGATSEFSACVVATGAASPGDVNCDGTANFDDIDPFVLALAGQAAYEANYPECDWLTGDIDGSGRLECGIGQSRERPDPSMVC